MARSTSTRSSPEASPETSPEAAADAEPTPAAAVAGPGAGAGTAASAFTAVVAVTSAPTFAASTEPAAAAAASEPAESNPPPIYRTTPPPPMNLSYGLRYGPLAGTGIINWQPGDREWALTLEATALGFSVLSQRSQGRFDAAGLAPERFVERRRGRTARAANFRRDAGLISFSASTTTAPLTPGAQDRLSWLVQVPAVLRANPALRRPGAELRLVVAGARGDVELWTLAVVGTDPVDAPAGRVAQALHLQRVPHHAHDTRADAWLDPARHFMPVRVRLRHGEDGEALELLLERASSP
jgi:hypothetical protein